MADQKMDQPQSPWLRTSFLLSATVVLLLIVGGIVVLVQPGAKPASAPSPAAQVSGESPSAHAEGCAAAGLTPVPFKQGEIRTSPPQQTTWTSTTYSSIASVPGIGPAITDSDGYRHCYAASLDGAALAAANYVAQSIDPALWEQAVRQGTVIRPDTEDEITKMAAKGGANTAHAKMLVVGLNTIRATSSSSAEVSLVVTYNGNPTSMAFAMVWDGDWRVQPPPDGSAIVADYTPWGGK